MANAANSATPAKRVVGRPFKPGQSGNPTGRPKIRKDLRDLARTHTTQAVQTLADMTANPKTPAMARVAAAQALLDRGYGKPTEYVQEGINPLEDMTDDDLAVLEQTLADSTAKAARVRSSRAK